MTTVRGTMVRGMMVMVNNNNSDDDDDDFVELLQIFVGQHRSLCIAELATYTKQGIESHGVSQQRYMDSNSIRRKKNTHFNAAGARSTSTGRDETRILKEENIKKENHVDTE